MNRLLMISNVPCLDRERLSTASGKYELSLAQGMAALGTRVAILSFDADRYEARDGIELCPCATKNRLTDFSDTAARIGKLLSDDATRTAILFFGYNPRLIDALRPFRDRAERFSVVYDTHRGTFGGKSLLRKAAIDAFYRRGLRKLRSLDGLILFRPEAEALLKAGVPCCLAAPTVKPEEIRPFVPTGNGRLRFLYAGTLCEYNSVQELAGAFLRLPEELAELVIFGDGPLAPEIKAISDRGRNVRYYGRRQTEELEAEIRQADVLVNLRDMASEVNRYAFPSKLVEYMAFGKAVMSTRVTEHPLFADAVFLAEDTREETVAGLVEYICGHREELPKKTAKAAEYLRQAHDAATINQKLAGFLFGRG